MQLAPPLRKSAGPFSAPDLVPITADTRGQATEGEQMGRLCGEARSGRHCEEGSIPPPCDPSLIAVPPQIMKEEYGCVESHRLMDTRLMLCTIACSFSGFALVYDQLHPFPASLVVLTVCALSYPPTVSCMIQCPCYIVSTVYDCGVVF